jgi:REP element-mobilizing transposase RayT
VALSPHATPAPRLDIPNTLHNFIVRGIDRCDIFTDNADRERFLARLSALPTKSSTKCFAWALLANHLHLLLMLTTAPLAETMRRLLNGYAVYFNRQAPPPPGTPLPEPVQCSICRS